MVNNTLVLISTISIIVQTSCSSTIISEPDDRENIKKVYSAVQNVTKILAENEIETVVCMDSSKIYHNDNNGWAREKRIEDIFTNYFVDRLRYLGTAIKENNIGCGFTVYKIDYEDEVDLLPDEFALVTLKYNSIVTYGVKYGLHWCFKSSSTSLDITLFNCGKILFSDNISWNCYRQ